MKKSLVLALCLGGIMANAFAANPFGDVAKGHWAYDAVQKLADAGIIDGYGGNFGGEKLMTRYEMAQIVAKAMAKGANCDKLAAEFADELDNLGVRVSKLEKKSDNVKITGNIRYSYRDAKGNFKTGPEKTKTQHGKGYNRLRSRFWVNGKVNDNWQYTGMLEKNTFLDTANANDNINLMRAWLTGRVGGLKVEAGRCYFLQMSMIDGEGDGVKASYRIKDVNLIGWAMKNQAVLHHGGKSDHDPLRDEDRLYMLKAEGKLGNLDGYLAYWKVDCENGTEIFDACLGYPVAKDLQLTAEYFYGDGERTDGIKSDKNGFEAKLAYKGAKAAISGSWGVHTVYSDRPYSTVMSQSTFAGYAVEPVRLTTFGDGFKGWEVGGNYVFAKNITGGLKYFDYQSHKHTQGHARTLWSEMVFIF